MVLEIGGLKVKYRTLLRGFYEGHGHTMQTSVVRCANLQAWNQRSVWGWRSITWRPAHVGGSARLVAADGPKYNPMIWAEFHPCWPRRGPRAASPSFVRFATSRCNRSLGS